MIVKAQTQDLKLCSVAYVKILLMVNHEFFTCSTAELHDVTENIPADNMAIYANLPRLWT